MNKIVGNDDYSVPEKPISEEEFFFAEILGEAVQAPAPLTRYQMFLAKIAGREIEIPYPETRLEHFLAKAAGMDVETPVPITREEIYWSNYTAVIKFEVEGIPPLIYKSNGNNLINYRIDGAAGGVGDLDSETGKYLIPVTISGKNIFNKTLTDGYHLASGTGLPAANERRCATFEPVQISGSSLTVSFTAGADIRMMYSLFLNGEIKARRTGIESPFTIDIYNRDSIYIAFYNVTASVTVTAADISDIQMEYAAEATAYEPHTEITAALNLDAPLGTGESVSLADTGIPIRTINGTNILMVGTTVQPSKVYIKGEFKKITTTYVQSIEPDNTNNKIIFVVRAYRSNNDRMVRAGLVTTNDPAIGVNINVNSTVITSGCKVFVKEVAGVTPTTDNIKYTWTKTKVTDGEIWYVRSYVEYINSDNEQLIIYSDAAKASLDGII